MMCENCNKRPASIHITKIINGEKRKINLCEQCAALQDIFNNALNFKSIITSLMDLENTIPQVDHLNNNVLRCDNCGMAYDRFKKYGKFGCEKCYETFEPMISPIIKRMHGKEKHTGKIIKRGGENIRKKRKLQELYDKLVNAIEKEQYEKAAVFRDQIKELKEGIGTN